MKVELDAVELLGALADGTSYRYWTFNGKVPGPMVRVRVGDTVEVTMRNRRRQLDDRTTSTSTP